MSRQQVWLLALSLGLCSPVFTAQVSASPNGTAPTAASLGVDKLTPALELDTTELDLGDNLSVELRVQPAANCPPGAVLFDRLARGSNQGLRLDLDARGCLRLQAGGTAPVSSEVKLSSDRESHLLACFDPREQIVALYVDGRLVASLPKQKDKIVIIGSKPPLHLGEDAEGQHHFAGRISRLALYNRALKAEDAAALAQGAQALPGLVSAWNLTDLDKNEAADSVSRAASGAASQEPGKVIQLSAAQGKGLLRAPLVLQGAEALPAASGNGLTLWYRQPAREWLESLPFGNGRLGGTVFGGVETERIQLNEDTIWSGAPYNPANPAAPKAIAEARALLFAGKQKEAEELIEKSAMGLPKTMAQYQTLGSLLLEFPQTPAVVTGYQRSLDLDSAVLTTRFTREGVTYTREVFASAPDQVVVVRLSADRPHSLNLHARWITPFRDAAKSVEKGLLVLEGQGGKFKDLEGAIRFQSLVRAVNQGGTQSSSGEQLEIRDADSVVLLVSCGTNYVNYHDLSGKPSARARQSLEAAEKLGYEALLERHLQDYRHLFRRVALRLPASPAASKPTDERIRGFNGSDPSLAALYFQFGRYLLISSSRPGGQPANLQGLWNDALGAAWGGKYTININTEENYWPAETTNLAECAEPLFALVKDISVTGRVTAQTMYQVDGWVCHHNTDLWRATAPIDSAVGFWPMGGAWLCTHLWEHYQFSRDEKFLAEAYPVLKGSAQFFLGILVEDPAHHGLLTCPSMSPEHGGLVAGPTMDLAILRDLFWQTARASELLGLDADFRKRLLDTRARLAPYQIGKYGQLQEWLQDLDKENDTHRHLSHLYGLFPGAQLSPDGDPALFAAARKSLISRGMIGPGWSLAWKENLWARARDGDRAYTLLTSQLTPPKGGSQGGGSFPNLFDAHPPFQIDGNFAATSAIAEMLLQSQEGTLDILPALPTAWPDGEVHGLRARGGYEVDITWRAGRPTSVTVHAITGGPCVLRYAQNRYPLSLNPGQTLTWQP